MAASRENAAKEAKEQCLAMMDEIRRRAPFGYHDSPYPHYQMLMLHSQDVERLLDVLLNAALHCDRASRLPAEQLHEATEPVK